MNKVFNLIFEKYIQEYYVGIHLPPPATPSMTPPTPYNPSYHYYSCHIHTYPANLEAVPQTEERTMPVQEARASKQMKLQFLKHKM